MLTSSAGGSVECVGIHKSHSESSLHNSNNDEASRMGTFLKQLFLST